MSNVDKAFEKYCIVCCSYRQTNGSDKCENERICKHAWQARGKWEKQKYDRLFVELRSFIRCLKEDVTFKGDYIIKVLTDILIKAEEKR